MQEDLGEDGASLEKPTLSFEKPAMFLEKQAVSLEKSAVTYNSSAKNKYSVLFAILRHKNCYKILKLNHLFKEAARTRQGILGVTW